ncbi:Rrf2 family transcriptional regulator, group III [plant metagenome]|uniref:Rrf2 family transcriptional regulator, group III n=1 Tax=plant metagenome TaxID=1297885 RepID=A0A484P0J2_9ZZZZ
MLHVILHMARDEAPMTSAQIGLMLGTNAAVVRRTMAGLREAGYVRSEKGHHGGWQLACDLRQVTLLDVYHAVGGPRIFAIGADNHNPDCAVEQVVNAALADAMREAETLLITRLGAVSLADLAADFDRLCVARGDAGPGHAHG